MTTTTASHAMPIHPKLPNTPTCHPTDPIPEDPQMSRQRTGEHSEKVPLSQVSTNTTTIYDDTSSIESEPSTPRTEAHSSDDSLDELSGSAKNDPPRRKRRASTILVSEDTSDSRNFLGEIGGATQMVQRACCGGGCCMLKELKVASSGAASVPISPPQNQAFQTLKLRLGRLGLDSELTELADLPEKTVSFERLGGSEQKGLTSTSTEQKSESRDSSKHPPNFVKPHPPYDVYSAPLYHARELTKPGAEKRTFHFDMDVTDYPTEGGDVDFIVGGAVGVCASNPSELVESIMDCLAIPRNIRDKPILCKTTHGRWPTIWGDDEARELVTTRRELLTWCTDLQSYPPTKAFFRLLAEHTDDEHERKILTYLSSAQGQATFCDLRTTSYITVLQLLSAFPSSHPPLDHLLSTLQQLMPRFYSLSQDPLVSYERNGAKQRRLVEVAVTIHETEDFTGTKRTGVGSGFLERQALKLIEAEQNGIDPKTLDLRIPMFRGLMANPLAREFVTDGPMLLIGAGVGIAPFRGFVHRRLKSANCANKVWVLQGVRDSLLDELYSGDWGVHEDKVKKVVQSRRGEGRYVQEEVRHQADLVWFVINALDGRVFVCGSSKGMGEGVEAALVEVAMGKGGLNEEEAKAFWDNKKTAGQYIAETW